MPGIELAALMALPALLPTQSLHPPAPRKGEILAGMKSSIGASAAMLSLSVRSRATVVQVPPWASMAAAVCARFCARRDDHPRPCAGQHLGEMLAKPTRAAGDQRRLAVEPTDHWKARPASAT